MTNAAAAYAHFLPLAQAIDLADVKPFRLDADLVHANVTANDAVFAPIAAEVQAAAPRAPVAHYLELPALSLALIHAAGRVVEHVSTGDIKQHAAVLGTMREPMLAQLEVFASPLVNLANPDRVRTLRAGTSVLKRAHDGVNIAAYFAELGAAIEGKHPFTEAQLAALSAEGQWLQQHLTPTHAVTPDGPADPEAVIRDQIWTLLWQRDDAMRAASAPILGFEGVHTRLLALGARQASPHTPATTGTATPASPTTK